MNIYLVEMTKNDEKIDDVWIFFDKDDSLLKIITMQIKPNIN